MKDVDKYIKTLTKEGWSAVQTRKHVKLYDPTGAFVVTAPCSLSDRRGFLNLRAEVRRHVSAQ